MTSELEQMKSKHRRVLLLEVVFSLLTFVLLFCGFIYSLWALFFALILACVAEYFHWQRKRLERKIDTAEGVIAAKRGQS
jgi:hypothetical protein